MFNIIKSHFIFFNIQFRNAEVPAALIEEVAQAIQENQAQVTPARVQRTQVPRATIDHSRRRATRRERIEVARAVNSLTNPGKRQALSNILDNEDLDMYEL